MARSIGNSIADSLQLSLNYADRLLKELPADRFARFASVGGTTVESNHPAFILGHLALYGPRLGHLRKMHSLLHLTLVSFPLRPCIT